MSKRVEDCRRSSNVKESFCTMVTNKLFAQLINVDNKSQDNDYVRANTNKYFAFSGGTDNPMNL